MTWKNWRGNELLGKVDIAGRMAVEDTCSIILEAAQQQVPLDEATLLRSGRVIMAPSGPAGVICFGGGPGTGHPIVPYAVRWHENSANFQRGRKRFYLKDPVSQLGKSTLKKALEMRLGEVLR
jgi:hypothetical protein